MISVIKSTAGLRNIECNGVRARVGIGGIDCFVQRADRARRRVPLRVEDVVNREGARRRAGRKAKNCCKTDRWSFHGFLTTDYADDADKELRDTAE